MEIFNQKKTIRLLSSLLKKRVHHSLFFYGNSSVGKLTTALATVKSYFCINKTIEISKSANPNLYTCNQCHPCIQFNQFNHSGLNLVSSGDLIPQISFLQQLFIQNIGREEKIISHLIFLIKHLLYRHKASYLNRLKKKKASFYEGVILKESETEEFFHDLYLNLTHLENQQTDWITHPHFIQDISKLQNSLDRTFLSKNSLQKAINWSKTHAGIKKWIIIENIDQIHPDAIGLFLKPLEDPEPDTHFILISNDVNQINHQIISPLLSRCLKFQFNHLENSIGEILEKNYGLIPSNKDHVHFKSMNHYFNSFLKNSLKSKSRSSHNNHSPLNSELSLLNQPISHQLDHITNHKINLEEFISELKLILEFHLKEAEPKIELGLEKSNHQNSSSISTKILNLRFSDVFPLLKLLHEIEETLKSNISTDVNSHSFLRLSTFIKKNKILFSEDSPNR